MKKKEKQSIRSSDTQALHKQIIEMQKKLASIKSSRYTKPSKNVRELKDMRKKIAVLKTVIKERQLYESKSE